MGDKQSVKVVEQEDFLEPSFEQILRDPFEQILRDHMHKIGKEEKLARWVNGIKAVEKVSYLTEHMIKQSKVLDLQSLKNRSFAMQYGTAPKKLSFSGNHTARLSANASAGTPRKAKPSGK